MMHGINPERVERRATLNCAPVPCCARATSGGIYGYRYGRLKCEFGY